MSCGCLPIYCQLGVFTKEEFQEHKEESSVLLQDLPSDKEEMVNGFKFTYQGKEDLFVRLAKWASREHRCCAWLKVDISMEPFDSEMSQTGGKIVLTVIVGTDEGKKVFLNGLEALKGI